MLLRCLAALLPLSVKKAQGTESVHSSTQEQQLACVRASRCVQHDKPVGGRIETVPALQGPFLATSKLAMDASLAGLGALGWRSRRPAPCAPARRARPRVCALSPLLSPSDTAMSDRPSDSPVRNEPLASLPLAERSSDTSSLLVADAIVSNSSLDWPAPPRRPADAEPERPPRRARPRGEGGGRESEDEPAGSAASSATAAAAAMLARRLGRRPAPSSTALSCNARQH